MEHAYGRLGSEPPAVIAILLTLFDEHDAVDHAGLLAQVRRAAAAGVDGVGLGIASEIHRLTEDERVAVVAIVAEAAAASDLSVLASAGAASTAATVQRAATGAAAGATWLMVTPPIGYGLSEDAIVAHYRAVADAAGIPIMVQDAPEQTGVMMSAPLLARLAAEIDLITAIKVSVPKIVAAVGTSAVVLGGAGGADAAAKLDRGAVGFVPSTATPERFVELVRQHRASEHAAAWATWARLLPLLQVCGRSGDAYAFTQKEILRRAGRRRSCAGQAS